MIEHALRLYPTGYRAPYGQEIAEVDRPMTADLPSAARLHADAGPGARRWP
ncbi:hypothetical protein PV367_39625 [Streptomyces europaeiscabiei]|uniref:Uncharacterized protein n=1 Tax=Streptomyces europaeiscabiei TaxID=146819 RepID=A0AAJ2PYX8_9ACTN|nr:MULTISPECIES: hypothetical protein [Streptomyces]MDX3135773.1 hypothetical protein [Streptomyces europaeiscabiei]